MESDQVISHRPLPESVAESFPLDRISREEAAVIVGFAVESLANPSFVRRHRLPEIRIGRKRWYTRSGLSKWLADRGVSNLTGENAK